MFDVRTWIEEKMKSPAEFMKLIDGLSSAAWYLEIMGALTESEKQLLMGSSPKFNEYKLCFVQRNLCYFTTGKPSEQWGENWHYIHYEDSADPPFAREGEHILVVAIDSNLDTSNGHASPEMCNRGEYPWLKSWDFATVIHAGISLPNFVDAIKKSGGRVFFEIGGSKGVL